MFNVYGFFDYVDYSIEITRLKMQVEDMRDETLVEEIMDSPFSNQETEAIIGKFMFTGDELTEEERKKLIGFYILTHCENDLEVEK